jgi:hypothetical protein
VISPTQLAKLCPWRAEFELEMERDRVKGPLDTTPAVKHRLRKVFAMTVAGVGLAAAKQIWAEVSREHRHRRGRPRKSEVYGWDGLFLEVYDQTSGDPNPATLIRHMARFFYPYGHRYGYASGTPHALEQRIRRLIKDRDAGRLVRVGLAHYRKTPPSGGQ